MNRKLKMLGLALVAVMAMSAVAASGASALQFTAASYPVVVSGEQTAGNTHVFTYAGREVTCNNAKFDAIGKEAGPSNEVDVTPTYSDCHAIVLGNKLPATVFHNECKYNFTVGASLSGNEVHVICPAGKSIEIGVYSDAAHSTQVCRYAVGSQAVGGITYSNMATDATVATNSNVAATRLAGTLATCGGATATATYVSKESTVTGATEAGAPVNVDVG